MTCNYCDLPRTGDAPICQCPEINQCDGCRRNLLLDHRQIHRDEKGWPVMHCTAERYKGRESTAIKQPGMTYAELAKAQSSAAAALEPKEKL